MKPGTPGFHGERLVEAREARGFTASSLAQVLDVTRQAVANYESGRQTPHPDTLERIVASLNIPRTFFLTSPAPSESAPEFNRSMSVATKAARIKVSRRLGWLRQVSAFIASRVELPALHLPDFQVRDHRALSAKDIERFAQETRRFWGMGDGPISNVLWLLENNGVIVGRLQFEAEGLDGVSQWAQADGRPYMLIAADKECAARSRFDASHELAHLLLHRDVDQRQLNTAGDFKLIEQQAHRFAGAFLLPAATFSQDAIFPTLDRFRTLKARARVSIALMIKRAADLNFVTEDQERRLWMAYARRGWRCNEPLDSELEPEQPRLFRKAFELLFAEGRLTLDDVAQELPLARHDVEDLASLPRGYLSEERGNAAPVVALKPRQSSPERGTSYATPAALLQFPRPRS